MNNIERIQNWLTGLDDDGVAAVGVESLLTFLATLPPDDPWQPIETAPDDGLPFLAWFQSENKSWEAYDKEAAKRAGATHWMRVRPPRGGAG